MSAPAAEELSFSADFLRRRRARVEAAGWRLFRRYLGPQCPADASDVATVLMARRVYGHVHGMEILLGSDKLGRGMRWSEFEVIDREAI